MDEEAQKQGQEIAHEILVDVVQGMLADGLSAEFIARSLNLPLDKVRRLMQK